MVPVYIAESDEMNILRMHAGPILSLQKTQPGHVNMAMDLLCRVLHQMYQSTDVARLVVDSIRPNHADVFSAAAHQLMEKWSKSTQYTIFGTLRKILDQTAIDADFLARICILTPRKQYNQAIGKKYGSLPPDHPTRQRLEQWVKLIRANTKHKSDLGIRGIVSFFIGHCMPAFGLDFERWAPCGVTPEVVANLCRGANKDRKLVWVKLFVRHVLGCCDFSPPPIEAPSAREVPQYEDAHRIPVKELEELYKESQKNTKDELIFLLLLTTGIRIGGLSCIQLEHVASVGATQIVVKDSGRTIEKGKKWFTFMLTARVKQLVYIWITKERPAATCPYLFPGQGSGSGHLTTGTIRNYFNKLCEKTGLSGKHLHPHAIRHTYAHILLDTGNRVEVVSKLLGHASSMTTEKYYLKESAADVAKRAYIPWLDKDNRQTKIVPDFLINDKEEHKRQQKRRKMTSLDMFRH
jgi:site-specific recombinase XerC